MSLKQKFGSVVFGSYFSFCQQSKNTRGDRVLFTRSLSLYDDQSKFFQLKGRPGRHFSASTQATFAAKKKRGASHLAKHGSSCLLTSGGRSNSK